MSDKDIIKEYGDVLLNASHIIDDPPPVISVSPKIDIALGGGVPEGSLFIITGPEKLGKDQPLYSNVYTPTGPKQMGSLRIGDEILTPNGKSYIESIHPQGINDIYRVYFSDKTYTDCGKNHLWTVMKHDYTIKYQTLTLNEIIKQGLFRNNGGHKQAKFCIPIAETQYPYQHIKLDPYLLGVILGDGGISQNAVIITNTDQELLNYISNILDAQYKLQQIKQNKISYRIIGKYNRVKANQHKYINILTDYKLQGCTSKQKFIPPEYKYNTKEIRLELIRGLMDTDGFVSEDGRVDISSPSQQLINDISEVLRSLGYKCRIKERYTSCNGKQFLSYKCYISGNSYTELKDLFKLSRKRNRCHAAKHIPRRNIVKIEHLGRELTQCIKIRDPDGLYFTDNYIITHNTILALQFCRNAQHSLGRKIYYGNVEGRLKKRDLEGIYGLDLSEEHFEIVGSKKGHILSGEKYLAIFDTIIHNEPHSVCVIDSFSALAAESELVSDITDAQVAPMNRYLAKFTRRFANVLPINRVTLVGITHLMANINKFGAGKAKVEKSGNALKYAQDVKLWGTHKEPIKQGETQIGQKAHFIVENSAIGPPGQKVTTYIKYGRGIWNEYEVADLAKDFGIVEGKSWLTLPNGEKIQGMANFSTYLEENPNAYNDLKSQVFEMIGM